MVAHTCDSKYLEIEVRELKSKALPRKGTRPYLNNKAKSKKAGGMAQVVDHFPSNHEVLSSNPSTEKRKKKSI
jgi:hypothetical protein